VARLGRGVAAHVDDPLGRYLKEGLNNIWMHASTRRIGNNHVGMPFFLDQLLIEQVFHVACIEMAIAKTVKLGIGFGVIYGLGHVLYSDDFFGVSGNKLGNRASARIEVIDDFFSCEAGIGSGYLVQCVGLGRVGLVE